MKHAEIAGGNVAHFRKPKFEEHSFDNLEEMCSFLQRQIIESHSKMKTLAEKANVCPMTVSNLAHGKTRFPRFGTVLELLRALGYEVVVRR
jgi:DNA-binding Xre family transcriptional regulator